MKQGAAANAWDFDPAYIEVRGAMSDRQPVVSDPDLIRARAMETLFERLESLCEGAIAIDRAGHVVYVNEKYLPALRLRDVSEAIAGRSRRSSPTA